VIAGIPDQILVFVEREIRIRHSPFKTTPILIIGKERKIKSPHFSKEAADKFLLFKRVCPVVYSLLSSPLDTREIVLSRSKKNATTFLKMEK
jgi:hypothetical protein